MEESRWSQVMARLYCTLWDIFDSQWTAKNSVIHGVNLQDAQEKAPARLKTEITSAFQFGRHELTNTIQNAPVKSSSKDP
jgi:hypothetical protein